MKGKVLSIITAVLFGATMVASPILNAAPTDETTGAAGMEEQAPAPAKKKPAKKKKAAKKKAVKKAAKKKVAKKKAAKKKASKKKKAAEQPAEQPE